MAPYVAESIPGEDVLNTRAQVKLSQAFDTTQHAFYKYRHYLPVYDETTTFPVTELFDFIDRGHLADKAKPNLLGLNDPDVKIKKLTPRVGTEINGLQLSQLSDTQKNELALLIAKRGVVVFRDQDFKDIGVEKTKGLRQILRSSSCSRKKLKSNISGLLRNKTDFDGISLLELTLAAPLSSTTSIWGQITLPSTTTFEQVEQDGIPFRCLVTGQKALFVNPGFTKRIIGLKDEESDAILQLLFRVSPVLLFAITVILTLTSTSHRAKDIQVRVKWDEGTVALCDNRVTAHTAISDYDVHSEEEGLRRGFRITTLGERPVESMAWRLLGDLLIQDYAALFV
ncbi:putative Dioxygenase-like protein [Seiridium cardinale]|uniref:Dioxygenase-like protein n=1 Tax=Seiridium cardinale TaxID=138064 RepID=A0ABR2XUK3_9PEZI